MSRLNVRKKQQVLFPLQQVLIYRTVVLPQLRQFWDTIQSELADKGPYIASIRDMRMRLLKLYNDDKEAMKLMSEGLPEGWRDIKQMLYYQGFPYVPIVIRSELISRHHDNPLAGHFGIEKTCKLIARKYYWPILQQDVEAYVKGYNVCLTSKAVRHKPYGDLQSIPVSTYWWKDLSIDFVISLPILADWKDDSYNSILVIVDRFMKMVYYKPVKVMIDVPGLAKVIINVVVHHYGVPESIVTDQGSLFISKFWSLLCYFLDIKKKLSTTFHPQTNGQTERQNSTMEAYLRAFVNWEQDNWVRLLSMARFTYNNVKNTSTSYIPFKLNCGYHPRISFKEDVNPYLRSRSANKLVEELRKLMEICCQNLLHIQEL